VHHCGNDGNFLPYSAIFILFTVHYYFDTWIQMLIKSCVNHYFSLSFLRKKNTKEIRRHVYRKCRGNCQNCRRQLLRSTAIFNAIAVDWFQGNSRPGLRVWRSAEHELNWKVADTTESYPAKRESCVRIRKTGRPPRSCLSTSKISVHGKSCCLIWMQCNFSYYFHTKVRSRL
jgi:hypothetical protein